MYDLTALQSGPIAADIADHPGMCCDTCRAGRLVEQVQLPGMVNPRARPRDKGTQREANVMPVAWIRQRNLVVHIKLWPN